MIALLLSCAVDLQTPRTIVLDRAPCDACGMLISDGRFAAELVTSDGTWYEFDDPTCLFAFIADQHPSIGNVWFRDSTAPDEAWLNWQQVEFVAMDGAPMDGGFGAVPLGSDARAISFSAASSHALEARR
jgi:copper chaperone NosL